MASDMAMPDLPALPAHPEDLAQYIAANPSHNVNDLIQPYRQYENQLRAVFAQDRSNPVLEDPYINVLPLFNENTEHIKVRARNLEAESEEEKSKYIMPLSQDERRPDGSPATVRNLAEFQNNFNVFSESSLVDMDWSNVVAAGSSVINTLLPVPKEYTTTKRKLREYYHEKFCPASDVDLFLYGLNHEQAIEKIKQIEQSIRDALLNEVTVVRTKYALTIASQYPVRHVQIVLRVYKSVSEILTGFDIDAAGGAFDGKQVWVTPRALASFITQTNHIDLSRRSPSYENRLSKYSHRGFEVYWADLDRSRIDPTIFERSFARTLGLARLLILERLPTSSAREAYLNRRRQERGRPSAYRQRFHLGGNIKDFYEDEVADWLSEEEVSNYHTFTVPYGEKFNAKRIEKLCYTRDLLLNAEWNQPKEREVYLHRHPAFFGRVEDVIEDCCGTCPVPKTEEEIEVAEKEAEIYISGKVSFLIDDPGRQQIGSFNPLTEQDWTDMAYVGNTARLCQSIVNGDLDDVLNWLAQPDADANTRDYTGRTPLHLAVMASTPDVVKALIDHRARITARLADGRTALHLGASRGDTEMIKLLMDKSIENEEMEEERKDRRRAASKAAKPAADPQDGEDSQMRSDDEDEAEDESDDEMTDYAQTETDAHSVTTGSFIKIKDSSNDEDKRVDIVPDESDDDPDYYQIDVLAWDVPSSPLHLAIVGGHEDAVKKLCDYGADSILPVKFSDNDSGSAAAILTLVLALSLPPNKAKSMARLLLSLGAISSQAETNGITAFQRYVESDKLEMVETLLEHDKAGVKSAINHLAFGNSSWSPQAAAPLHTAIETGNPLLVLKLLAAGALVQFDYETWLKSAKVSPTQSSQLRDLDSNKRKWRQMVQPLALAINHGHFEMALALLENGADPNTLTGDSELLLTDTHRRSWNTGSSVLDDVNEIIKQLEKGTSEERKALEKPQKRPGLDEYMQNFQGGSYARWVAGRAVADAQKKFETSMTSYENAVKKRENGEGETAEQAKFDALRELTQEFAKLRDALIAKGAKTFQELHPNIAKETSNNRNRIYGSVSHYMHRPDTDSELSKKPFEVRFQFQGVSDMTDARRDAYIELFDAAWDGDLDKIKALTLQAWGPNQDEPPLKIAVDDTLNQTPFSIAFLCGHYDVATAILEIIQAQWSPHKEDKLRYKMKTEDDDDSEAEYSDEDAGSEDSDDQPQLVAEKAEHQYTIDDVGQVSMSVESHVTPLETLRHRRRCFKKGAELEDEGVKTLFAHCVDVEDAKGLKYLIGLGQHWARNDKAQDLAEEEEEGHQKRFTVDLDELLHAVKAGKTDMLGILIKQTGAGIPLDHLVKKSGATITKKPRFYQGLTVYGKKRKDWANAGRNMVTRATGIRTPPLLHAALAGSIESTEFFLSDAPHRLYSEFGKSKAAKEDIRLKVLRDRPGGFDRAIATWLGADNELVIHCAVRADIGERSNELLDYLIQTCPTAIDKKTPNGDTPLMVACRLGRCAFARLLVAGNADQSTRNSSGENLMHAVLALKPSPHRLRTMMSELDLELVADLCTQRNNLAVGGQNPLQRWVATMTNMARDDKVEMLRLILEYARGQGVDTLDAKGDTALHAVIMAKDFALIKALVDFNPALLQRENAVGRTPAEIAEDNLKAKPLKRPGGFAYTTNTRNYGHEMVTKSPNTFQLNKALAEARKTPADRADVENLGLRGDYTVAVLNTLRHDLGLRKPDEPYETNLRDGSHRLQAIWDLCSTAMERYPAHRRLVSLNEANDVARRLGEQEKDSGKRRWSGIHSRRRDEEEEEEGEEKEEDTNNLASKMVTNHMPTGWATFGRKTGESKGLDRCTVCECWHE